MHRILGGEGGAPEEGMGVEIFGDRLKADLGAPVAALVQHAFDRQVDRRSPGVVADRRRAAAHPPAAEHAGRPEHGIDLRLMLADIDQNLLERLDGGPEAGTLNGPTSRWTTRSSTLLFVGQRHWSS